MQKPVYIPTLDGWRTLAILNVLYAHAVFMHMHGGNRVVAKFTGFISNGNFGVDIFFALSGFLICTLLLNEKERLGGRIDLGRFYTRRVFRILPPLMVYLGVLAILHLGGDLPRVNYSELLYSLGFIRNYTPGEWFSGHFWSLSIEEHFYLVIPFLLLLLPWRSALVTAICLSLASSLARFIDWRYGIVQQLVPWTHSVFRSENRLDGLMNGAILALLVHKQPIRDWIAKRLSPTLMIGLMAATVLTVGSISSPPAKRTIVSLVLPIAVAFTVLRPESLVSRLLEQPAIRWVGRLSYSLYIWQQLFLIPNTIERSPDLLGTLQSSYLSFLATIACAIASYHLIEKPMIRIGHRLAASPGLNKDLRVITRPKAVAMDMA